MNFHVYETSKKFFERHFHNSNFQLFAQASVTSTSDLAKEEAFSLSSPLKIYLCDQQQKGRGRGKNTWTNPPSGSSLMLTASFDIGKPPQPICTPLMGLQVYRSIVKNFAPTKEQKDLFSIKAPNDVLFDGKKILGILAEVVHMGEQNRLLVGLGLNVWAHPADVPTATSLAQLVTDPIEKWDRFLEDLLTGLHLAAQGSTATHLSESERADLLYALNLNPHLSVRYDSVSPFGDLCHGTMTTSWRNL